MKQRKKSTKVFAILVALVVVLVCSINVVYAYFTASTRLLGDESFHDLDAYFAYSIDGASPVSLESGTMTVYAKSDEIPRGGYFQVSTSSAKTNTITYINTAIKSDSCDTYIRFWLSAYIVTAGVADTTVDYGQYFTLCGANGADLNSTYFYRFTAGGLTTYYLKDELAAGESATIMQTIKQNANASQDLIGQTIELRISMQAVQKGGGAYSIAFTGRGETNSLWSTLGWE